MDETAAIDAFAALSQDTRLAALRLLVTAGPAGLPAGDVARALAVPHNTLSTHLAVLTRAGLVQSRRESRSVIYRADFTGLRSLIDFLLRDCCRGAPDLCIPLLDAALPAACGAAVATRRTPT